VFGMVAMVKTKRERRALRSSLKHEEEGRKRRGVGGRERRFFKRPRALGFVTIASYIIM
jgi:hypothetical protein